MALPMALKYISSLQRLGNPVSNRLFRTHTWNSRFWRIPKGMMKSISDSCAELGSRAAVHRHFKAVLVTATGISLYAIRSLHSGSALASSQCQSHLHLPGNIAEEIDHEASILGLSETARVSVQKFGLLQRISLVMRLFYLCLLFSPAAVMYGVSHIVGSPSLACYGWRYIMAVLQTAGPAFIKLGQWASTRRDLFTEDFCRALSDLHVNCNSHSWEDTVRQLETSLGQDWDSWLVITNHTPIGSGSVAQVYEGVLHVRGGSSEGMEKDDEVCGREIQVAVKVLHPNVVNKVKRDIYLMKYVASWIQTILPDVHWVALTDCVDEFSSIMEKQVLHNHIT